MAIESLQVLEYHSDYPVLLSQHDYSSFIKPGGGGACSTVSAVNLIQVLRQMLGIKTVLDATQVAKESFEAIPALKNGRVTNDQMIELLTYLKKYVPASSWSVSAEAIGTRNSLQPNSNQLKLITYTMTRSNGRYYGRHFVILNKISNNELYVLDPNLTSVHHVYDLSDLSKPNKKGATVELFISGSDPKAYREFTFILDSVFTVTFER